MSSLDLKVNFTEFIKKTKDLDDSLKYLEKSIDKKIEVF